MFARLANFVVRHWMLVIAVWVAIPCALHAVAPSWNDVTHDGDLAYLPADMPTAVAERLLAQGFPHERAKSQMVVLAARSEQVLSQNDFALATDLARRLLNLEGVARFHRARELSDQAHQLQLADPDEAGRLEELATAALDEADDAFSEAILLDEQLAAYWTSSREAASDNRPALFPPRLASAYFNRAQLYRYLGRVEEAEQDHQRAIALDPALARAEQTLIPAEAVDLPLLDVWTWYDDVFGKKLISDDKQALLIVLQLSNEFMATDNMRVLHIVEETVNQVRPFVDDVTTPGLAVGISGSAAVGGDMLRSAANSIQHTELFTILLVVLILIVVYRSPLLVLVPVLTIVASLYTATSIVALLTQLGHLPGFSWWEMKIFTTTKIFIVVILFGAGTDFCLFLIARYREELRGQQDHGAATSRALIGVGDALVASALTTILGLGTMYFADFGKFRYSGPVIGLCLAVTLIACLTLTPALLSAMGRFVFWPVPIQKTMASQTPEASSWFWRRLAHGIVRYPITILLVSTVLMLPWAVYGAWNVNRVTYDFLGALPMTSPSRRGAELLRSHFPVGESGPLTIVAWKEEGGLTESEAATGTPTSGVRRRATEEAREQIRELTHALYIDGVRTVRSLSDPLGNFPPSTSEREAERGSRYGIMGAGRRALHSHHPRAERLFLAQSPDLQGDVMRLDVVLDDDPFSVQARQTLAEIDQQLTELSGDPNSYWHDTTFAYSGITAGVRDLRAVTQSDNRRIQILVVLAVLAVLLVILKRPLVSLYMIASVLFSYYVTMGLVIFLFSWVYGDAFQGLDWKLPLFLFVILVAVGEDYNVYLATRVFEEQRRLGPFAGLRRAIVCTGGIITSCGVIMAGTFISMTSGTWGTFLPDFIPLSQTMFANAGVLRGIVEMGVALALGVVLDTFVVRPILVPAFLALGCRWTARSRGRRPMAKAYIESSGP